MDSKGGSPSPTIKESIPSSSQTQFDAYAPANPPNLWKVFQSQVTTKEGWWGEFDWKSMCLPTIFNKEKKNAPFWGLNSRLPLGLAIIMGFQHSLAMVRLYKKKIFFFFYTFISYVCV
jgi:NCS2 family nucleobase:cation symporter-2